ncbi:hypothetical protein [Fibrobacter intestinalis]|uniref:Uncharacterized protein n=1 Tax=Fibrobacter intestinalis TaxID=28122 RepID=A0A1T4Q781_9BACT|nr:MULTISPECIES: hypothetical protein [Fibrobacter]SJZ99622.1 hypothetical protein SAMN02745108_02193 [Fibrobacter intestinalis]
MRNRVLEGPTGWDPVLLDTTVQEKSVTFPTDAKLANKIIEQVQKIVGDHGLPQMQFYRWMLKKIRRDRRFCNRLELPRTKGIQHDEDGNTGSPEERHRLESKEKAHWLFCKRAGIFTEVRTDSARFDSDETLFCPVGMAVFYLHWMAQYG